MMSLRNLITTEQLAERLDDPVLIIIDVRHDLAQPMDWGEAQYRKSHIPGALFAHLDRDLSTAKTGRNGRHPLPSVADSEALFSRFGIDAEKDVVAYDQGGGMYASRVWWMLRWLGHASVAVLDGGFEKWMREGRPVNNDIVTPTPASFDASGVAATLDVDDVIKGMESGSVTLVDARMRERYRGETEPIDPVAGHIPGARNRPYADNLNADGTFKSPDALRTEFAAFAGDAPLDRIVHYCGSGVTACHNVLAMEVAGLPGTRIYPGSWSEWIADASRPVALGDEVRKR
ncbi:MAG TPA: sulfurtransferase [Casimicrobiaceae bacterium]|nr:sulfurtransferase [Casimicrobiaceae bacterium]